MIYEAERGDISIAVVGDAMISRRMREFREPQFLKLVDLVRGADVSLANLEFLFHDFESSWGWSHGTYTRGDHRLLDELTWMGFDGVFTANNHSFDFSEGGFLTTLKHLNDRNIPHAGGGKDIDHARAPGYVDSARGRVAFMSGASTFTPVSRAGAGRADFPGRPGISTLRRNTVHHVPKETFDALVRANRELGFEAQQDAQARFGFIAPPRTVDRTKSLKFLEHDFRLGEAFRKETTLDKDDMEGISRWLRGARKQADWTVYGLHAHESGDTGEFHGGSRTSPPDFMIEFAHRMIDQGCDVIAGAGPHYLRGIEIYKNRPIFYSLGNFIMQNETVDWIPGEAYRNFGLGAEHVPGDYFEDRSDGGKRGFPADPKFWEALLPVCTFRGRKLHEIKLYPVDLGYGRPIPQRGRPVLAEGEAAQRILEWVRDLSKELGTRVDIHGGVGTIKL
jgi:hypothetical protein